MNYYNDYPSAIMGSLQQLYEKVLLYMPNFLAAVIVLILGWIIGSALGGLVKKLLEVVKIDHLANQLGMDKLSEKTGRSLSIARFGEWLIKWFFFLGTLIAAADILGLEEVTAFLYGDVLPYAGHVIVAMAILLLGIVAANFFGQLVTAAVRASGMVSSAALGSLTRWAIIAFAVIAALSKLQLATEFLQDLFRAIVAMLAIAGGLAFGLGGKDHARKILDEVENGLRKKV